MSEFIEGVFGLISGLVRLIEGIFEMLFTGTFASGGGKGLGFILLFCVALFTAPLFVGFIAAVAPNTPDWILSRYFSTVVLVIFFALTCLFILAYVAVQDLMSKGMEKVMDQVLPDPSKAIACDTQANRPLEEKSHGWVVFFTFAVFILGLIFIVATQIERKSARELRCEAIAEQTTGKVGAASERLGRWAERVLREDGWIYRYCAGLPKASE